jgi:hypothetical protein
MRQSRLFIDPLAFRDVASPEGATLEDAAGAGATSIGDRIVL